MSFSLSLARPWQAAAIAVGFAFLLSGLVGIRAAKAADTIPPTVGMATYSGSVYVNAAESISASYADTAEVGETPGVASCTLLVNGSNSGAATLSGSATTGTASADFTFTSAGSYDVNMRCTDNAGNMTTGATTTLTAIVDAAAPSVSAVSPTTAVRGSATVFSVTYADAGSGVSNCILYVQQTDGTYATYNMTESGGMASGVASYTYSYSSAFTNASYGQYATCTDASGNIGTGSVTAISLTNPAPSDTTAPVVSGLSPISAVAGQSVAVSASYSDAVGVTTCSLYVDGSLVGTMSLSGTTSGTASRNHTFTTAGTYTSQVRCSDAAGNTGSASTSVSVSVSAPGPFVRRLIKLVCPSGFIDVNHPCKAVYYVGSDNRRHAFPNEKVYFTWYTNFNDIIELDTATMASIALGKNVNYRPGTRMVKFTTLNRTYAVARYGTLRWVTSEAVAISLYGPDWNRMIDDISDAFYTDYTFGADINSASQYNPSAEASAVTIIDQNL